ncbi:MAG: YARHG domain-containing protein [Flavobacteriales bacterium]
MRSFVLILSFLFCESTSALAQGNEPDTSYYEEEEAIAEEDTSVFSFESFIGLFRTAGITTVEPMYSNTEYVLNLIPGSAVDQYFGGPALEFNSQVYYYAKELLEEENYYLFVYILSVPVGPGLERVYVQSFDLNGNVLSGELLGDNYSSSGPDGEGAETVYYYETSTKALKVVLTTSSFNMETEEEEKHDAYAYYKVDSLGYITRQAGRLYPEASERVLSESELSRYTKDELLIMRNEIFADHGYIFKTDPLKTYFSEQAWYTPLFDKVDDQLTEIEEENLKLILAAEKKLK